MTDDQTVERVGTAILEYAATLPEHAEFRSFLRSNRRGVARAAIQAMKEMDREAEAALKKIFNE